MSLLCVCVHDVVGLEGGPIYPGSILILPPALLQGLWGRGFRGPQFENHYHKAHPFL